MLPPSIPISQPVRSPRGAPPPAAAPPCHLHSKHDLLVWFEICELAPNGEYVPAVSSLTLIMYSKVSRKLLCLNSLFIIGCGT